MEIKVQQENGNKSSKKYGKSRCDVKNKKQKAIPKTTM